MARHKERGLAGTALVERSSLRKTRGKKSGQILLSLLDSLGCELAQP
jgi:hypothetical protein